MDILLLQPVILIRVLFQDLQNGVTCLFIGYGCHIMPPVIMFHLFSLFYHIPRSRTTEMCQIGVIASSIDSLPARAYIYYVKISRRSGIRRAQQRTGGIRVKKAASLRAGRLLIISLILVLLALFCSGSAFAEEAAAPELILSQSEMILLKGQTKKLTWSAENVENPRSVTTSWISSDPTVVSVSGGTLTARGTGTAEITCIAKLADGSEISSSCSVTVQILVKAVNIKNRAVKLLIGRSTEPVEFTISPAQASCLTVTWTSSDETVAAVDENGVITAVGAGKAVITATSDEKMTSRPQKATVAVTVSQPVTGISITNGDLSIPKGRSVRLTAAVGPDNAANRKVIWTSSDPRVASVSGGTVTGKKAGTATITATAADGSGVSDSITVEVLQAVTGIKTAERHIALFPGESAYVSASVSPADATNKDVTWTSDDPGIASVSSDGLVTANSAGTAILTVTAADGSGKQASMRCYVEPAVPVTIISSGEENYKNNKLTLTVKNMCSKTTIVNFDFDLKLIGDYGTSGSKSYGLGRNEPVAPGKQRYIRRTLSGLSSADRFTITVTGVTTEDGHHYAIPFSEQEAWTFSVK